MLLFPLYKAPEGPTRAHNMRSDARTSFFLRAYRPILGRRPSPKHLAEAIKGGFPKGQERAKKFLQFFEIFP